MATTDVFPLDCDYPMQIPYSGNVLTSQMKGGKTFKRMTAPPVRSWQLTFASRPVSDWDTLENFYRSVLDDFFTWTDPIHNRSYSVYFGSDPQFSPAANESVNISVTLVEAVGVPLAAYPGTPTVITLAGFVTVGNSKFRAYAGYGIYITGTGIADVLIDGVSVGVGPGIYAITLGLHRVEVRGSGSPPSITFFAIFT